MATYESLSPRSVTFMTYFNVIVNLASLVGLVISIKIFPKDEGLIYAIFVVAIAITSIIVNIIYVKRKRHRYAQVIEHVHRVNHIARDGISALRCAIHKDAQHLDLDRYIQDIFQSILDSINHSFSLTTGTSCRVCIKETWSDISKKEFTATYVRDGLSFRFNASDEGNENKNDSVEGNTDFKKLSENPKMRFFFSNNLIRLFIGGKYANSSIPLEFTIPKMNIFQKLFYDLFPKWWPLPYRSTIVVPIRYIDNAASLQEKTVGVQSYPSSYHYYGYLCVDSKKRNVFDYEYGIPLLAAYADILYLFFADMYVCVDEFTS